MENVNMNRRCGFCERPGHDIRNCQAHINQINNNLINDFTDNGPNTAFPLLNRRIVYKLGDIHGLSRNLNYNNYLERLILIYIHLGEQRRQERRDRRNLENDRRLFEEQQRRAPVRPTIMINENTNTPVAQILVPFPITPQAGRFRNILSVPDLEAIRESFRQLTFEIEEELVFREIETAPVFESDPSRFTEENTVCECPICYELKPSVLTNCSHSYCETCISKMIDARRDYVICALCRERVTKIYFPSEDYMATFMI